MNASKKIVVGIDGSEGSNNALRWAISESKLRGTAIEVVHVWNFVPIVDPISGMAFVPTPDLQESAELLTKNTVQSVSELAGSVTITTHTQQGNAAEVLIKHSQQADLLVVGRRGHGGFIGLLIGSTAEQVTRHASCPVVVVPV